MILLFGKDQVLYEHPWMSCSLLTIPCPSGRPAINLPWSPQLYHSTCGRGSPSPSLSTNSWCLSRALRQKAMPLTLTSLIPCYCPTRLWVPLPNTREGRGLEADSVTNSHWFNQSHLSEEPLQNTRKTGFRELWVGEPMEILGEWYPQSGHVNSAPLFNMLPSASLPSGCSWVMPFYNKLII